MKGTYLGEFEELVLLATAVLVGNAYSVTIAEAIEEQSCDSLDQEVVDPACSDVTDLLDLDAD